MTTTTVAGLEMYAVPHLLVVRCDRCGACWDGRKTREETKNEGEFRARAWAHGWRGPITRDSTSDLCPSCAGAAAPDAPMEGNG